VVVTKVGAQNAPGVHLAPAQRPEQLRAQVEANLTILGVEQLAVVNLRRLDAPPGLLAEGDQLVDIDAQLAELIALRAEGKIGAIGLGSVGAGQLRHALPVGIACVQNLHNPLDRSSEAVLEACREHQVAWVPFFPLGSAGFRGLPRVIDHPAVAALAGLLGLTPAQIVIAWHLAQYDRTLLIAGTTNPHHLDQTIAAAGRTLDPETLDELDELAAPTGVA
jgi:aryl-alcohol dehydrogenase-like predicted oxidoreductase